MCCTPDEREKYQGQSIMSFKSINSLVMMRECFVRPANITKIYVLSDVFILNKPHLANNSVLVMIYKLHIAVLIMLYVHELFLFCFLRSLIELALFQLPTEVKF